MAKKHLTAMAVFIALSACVAADRNTESEAKQSGVTFSGTASMGIARDGN